MSEISRVKLFEKLNSVGYKAIESATVFCKLRGNPYVELVHWFHQILQTQDSDIHRIVRHFQLEPSRLAKDFTEEGGEITPTLKVKRKRVVEKYGAIIEDMYAKADKDGGRD